MKEMFCIGTCVKKEDFWFEFSILAAEKSFCHLCGQNSKIRATKYVLSKIAKSELSDIKIEPILC